MKFPNSVNNETTHVFKFFVPVQLLTGPLQGYCSCFLPGATSQHRAQSLPESATHSVTALRAEEQVAKAVNSPYLLNPQQKDLTGKSILGDGNLQYYTQHIKTAELRISLWILQ